MINRKSPIKNNIRTALTLVLCITFFFACKKNISETGNIEISNESGSEVVVINTQNAERFSMGLGQSRNITTNLGIDKFLIEAPAGDNRGFGFEISGGHKYVIYSYGDLLEYRISGLDTKTAKLSYIDDSGNKISASSVNLPYVISYKKFSGNKWFLQAENLEQKGFVSIQVLIKGRLRTELSNPQSVASSGNIDGTSSYK